MLGYDDRSRIIDDEHRGLSVAGARFVVVDGQVAGAWTFAGNAESGVRVRVTPLRALTSDEREEIAEEGGQLAIFLADGGRGQVELD